MVADGDLWINLDDITDSRMNLKTLFVGASAPATTYAGQILITLTPELMEGQIVHIHASQTSVGTFQIDQDFRITEVQHVFTMAGAMTKLTLTDDLHNSIPRTNASSDDYNILIKAFNPDTQTQTMKSLKVGNKVGGDFDPDLTVIAKDYPS